MALAVIFVLTVGCPRPASATTLGTLFCNAFYELAPFGDFFSYVAYLIGCIFIGQGLYGLKSHMDSPANHPLHRAIGLLAGGAGLLSAPAFASTIIMTLFMGGGSPATPSCSAGSVSSSSGQSLDVLLTNFLGNVDPALAALVSLVAWTMGAFMIVNGLIKASKYGHDPRANSPTHFITSFIIGAMLIAIGQSFSSILTSIFGSSAPSGDVLSWSGDVNNWSAVQNIGSSQFTEAIKAALTFFQVVGMISLVRGFHVMKKAVEGSGQATIPQGLTHIIGGVLAINIYQFLEIMDTTFGTGFLSG